jgi:very-short-patch-repair endonuclease
MAADQVARSYADQRPAGSAGAVGVLKDETKKSRKLKPVRRLVEEAGEAIQRFKPVFLMSPLSVAQYLPPGQIQFDLCVIDEASQVRPEDALGAVARCKQLVVVGDDKQLPPTNFFSRMVADDDVEEQEVISGEVRAAAVKDVESILNLCSRFPERMLRWHYRSEHPALIATSNRNFYKNQLMLPPSVVTHSGDQDIGLQFVQVRKGGYERGKTATNEVEADEVAKAVLDHVRRNPTKSLGIGTFSVAQRDCVRDRLEHWAANYPELDEFMRGNADRDPLFVKNLENIQGDERDVIFISVGYGHDQDGRLTQQFGPIGRDGGERRLNVLITRARQRCVVFSSIVAEDIRTEGAPKPGIAAFREFLKLAKDGFKDLAEATARGFDSDFEESVAMAIKELGYEVHPQVGMAGFFVDLGVLDPRDDKKYLLGVECDGAAYHSSSYARDRDRLRQSILESRGWKMHRVWSTDWFYRQDREISKLKVALEAAISSNPDVVSVDHPKEDPEISPDNSSNTFFVDEEEKFSLLPPYRFAQLKWNGRTDILPHELQLGQLTELVSKIVATEQPIHSEEVGRRLATMFNLQRAGSRIQEAALRGLKDAARSKYLVGKKGFWRLADAAQVQARDRSQLPAAATVRRPDLICPTEIAQAARVVLTASLALEREELVTETARALGFLRTGPDVSHAIGKAIVVELGAELQTDHMGRVRLAQN